MEMLLVDLPHIAEYPIPFLAEVRRLFAKVGLVVLNPLVRLSLAEMLVRLSEFTDEVVCVQLTIALLAELHGRDESCVDIWFAMHGPLRFTTVYTHSIIKSGRGSMGDRRSDGKCLASDEIQHGSKKPAGADWSCLGA